MTSVSTLHDVIEIVLCMLIMLKVVSILEERDFDIFSNDIFLTYSYLMKFTSKSSQSNASI